MLRNKRQGTISDDYSNANIVKATERFLDLLEFIYRKEGFEIDVYKKMYDNYLPSVKKNSSLATSLIPSPSSSYTINYSKRTQKNISKFILFSVIILFVAVFFRNNLFQNQNQLYDFMTDSLAIEQKIKTNIDEHKSPMAEVFSFSQNPVADEWIVWLTKKDFIEEAIQEKNKFKLKDIRILLLRNGRFQLYLSADSKTVANRLNDSGVQKEWGRRGSKPRVYAVDMCELKKHESGLYYYCDYSKWLEK